MDGWMDGCINCEINCTCVYLFTQSCTCRCTCTLDHVEVHLISYTLSHVHVQCTCLLDHVHVQCTCTLYMYTGSCNVLPSCSCIIISQSLYLVTLIIPIK